MKNVLFLNQSFYNYDRLIQDRLKKNGYVLHSYSLFPQMNMVRKAFDINGKQRLNTMYLQQKGIINDIKNKKTEFSTVFVLAGNDLLESTVLSLRELYPKATFVWYIWDSIKNILFFKEKYKYFDTIISFDIIEAKQYGLVCIPLFYSIEESNHESSIKYDLSIIGSNHGDRYEIVSKVMEKMVDKTFFAYLCSGKIVYFKNILNNGRKAKRITGTKPMDYDDAIAVMRSSRCILDIQDVNQTGLTMRTIEALGLKKKIITTNDTIRLYNFFNENNIYIIDRKNPEMPVDDFFFNKPECVEEAVVKQYYIDSWCRQVSLFF